ncbi:Alpha/Beta hydrolase protein [Usnea florida]
MRILCVHGFGSNPNVMKVQAAPLRQELRRIIGHDAELDFTYLQGGIESQPFPGVGELFSPPYYSFWNGDSPSSVLAAIDLVSSSIDADNVDIIFAHSDGGAAALSALLHRAHNVKCIILISPFPPFDASGRKRLDVSMAGPLVHIPTLLVLGESDPLAFFVAMAKGLVDEKNLTVYSWKGGHEAPNSSERGMWAQMAQDVVQILDRK